MRKATLTRDTKETQISLELNLDGSGKATIDTGIGFLDHMLTLLAFHGDFDLTVKCQGDLEVDCHHSTEDIAIALGKCFDQALGERRGIKRYGSFTIPMDEALVTCDLDISGRPYLVFNVDLSGNQKLGNYDTEMTEEFFRALAFNAGVTLHLNEKYGKNTHHIIEACFKSTARALKHAVSTDKNKSDAIPSSKGII
ncbi:imidazoleglycerol-phosphate dehydratase HisB [Lactococcus hircilactis]|uniref:Imidazoleglycerol-phosphate dehydratase n=1 Tax=Lactococcus hircilactis TaxID=1494462 RepID=A0A7X1Z7M9_9LACT|nr:imidazoleglycerol-phosphate dehydratase HisB [Lactococcus hircilactis]MQW39177.1 imidazoleglycerol-phosphate dehydratase HisB [Lactococcus hircilactis]